MLLGIQTLTQPRTKHLEPTFTLFKPNYPKKPTGPYAKFSVHTIVFYKNKF
jgi:hypothetical protein